MFPQPVNTKCSSCRNNRNARCGTIFAPKNCKRRPEGGKDGRAAARVPGVGVTPWPMDSGNGGVLSCAYCGKTDETTWRTDLYSGARCCNACGIQLRRKGFTSRSLKAATVASTELFRLSSQGVSGFGGASMTPAASTPVPVASAMPAPLDELQGAVVAQEILVDGPSTTAEAQAAAVPSETAEGEGHEDLSMPVMVGVCS